MEQAQAKPQFLVYRKLGTLVWSAFSQSQTIDLDRLHGLRFIDIHADVQWDGSGGAADGALLAGAPFHMFTGIVLKGNGKDAIINTTGYGNYLQNFFDYRVAPASTLPAVTGTGAANYAFSWLSRLDLALPYNRVPVDTALISSLFASLQLAVTLGSKSDIVNATNDRTVAFDTATADVYVGEIVNFDASRFGKIVAKHYYIEATPSATSANFDVVLPVGNAYRSILIETVAPSANPTPVNTVLNNIQVKSGSEVFVDLEDDIARRGTALERGIGEQTGAFFLDFSRDGLIAEALDASLVNNLKLTLDVTLVTGNRIRCHCIELIPA